MNPRDEVLSALRGELKGKPPASSVTQVGTVEAMDKIGVYWPEAHSNPEKMVALGASLYKLAGLKTARIPFCLTVEAEAMGATVELGTKDKQPSVRGTPYTAADQITPPTDFLSKGRVPAVIKGTQLLRQREKDLPAIVGTTGPFTIAGHLIGVEKYLLWSIKQHDNMVKVFDVTTDVSIEYAKALIDAGADVISVSEPNASPDLLSPKEFANTVKPRLTKLGNAISSKGAIGVLHICGTALKIIKDMSETGFTALSIEEKVDLAKAREIIGAKPLVGNISAARTMFSGTPDMVKEEAKRAIDAGINVLGPGCGIAPRTPLANIKALVSTTQ